MHWIFSWRGLGVLTVLGFVLVNLFVSYLFSRVVPFEVAFPLYEEGYSGQFEIDRFYHGRYTLMLALDHPEKTRSDLLRNRGDVEIRQDFDAEFRLALLDSQGNALITHVGGVDGWYLTNGSPTTASDGAFWLYQFDARLFGTYRLDLEVIRSNNTTERYRPTILFHGLDDGYFGLLLRPVANALWAVVVMSIAIGGLVTSTIRQGRLRSA